MSRLGSLPDCLSRASRWGEVPGGREGEGVGREGSGMEWTGRMVKGVVVAGAELLDTACQ